MLGKETRWVLCLPDNTTARWVLCLPDNTPVRCEGHVPICAFITIIKQGGCLFPLAIMSDYSYAT